MIGWIRKKLWDRKLSKAIRQVAARYTAMSPEEFQAALDKYNLECIGCGEVLGEINQEDRVDGRPYSCNDCWESLSNE